MAEFWRFGCRWIVTSKGLKGGKAGIAWRLLNCKLSDRQFLIPCPGICSFLSEFCSKVLVYPFLSNKKASIVDFYQKWWMNETKVEQSSPKKLLKELQGNLTLSLLLKKIRKTFHVVLPLNSNMFDNFIKESSL